MNDDDDYISVTLNDIYNTSPLTTSLAGGYSVSTSLPISINSGTVGATLSTTLGGSNVTWNNTMWTNNTVTATASPYVNATAAWATYGSPASQGSLRVSGDAEFDGDIKIKGVNLTERLDAIEERLGILRPNNDLEGKWEQLKALGEEYRRLEKEIIEKESMWEMLKK